MSNQILIICGVLLVCGIMTYVETLPAFIKFSHNGFDNTPVAWIKAFSDASTLVIAFAAMTLLLMGNKLQYPLWIAVESVTVILWIVTWITQPDKIGDSIQSIWNHGLALLLDVYGHCVWHKKNKKNKIVVEEAHII